MDSQTKARYEELAKISKAMAHPSRMFIIEKLNEQEYCVNELTEMIGVDVSTVSRHLSILKNAGIISFEKRKNQIYYTLRCPCVMNIFSCVLNVIQTNFDSAREIIEN